MKVSFDDLSKLGVTEIVRVDFAGSHAGLTYALEAQGPHILENQIHDSPEVAWSKDPANRGKIYQGPIILQPNGDHKTPFMIMATPVYEESVDESHPKATGNLDGVLLFKIDLAQFTGHYCANIRSGRTGYCWVQHLKSLEETLRRESRIIGDALDRGSLDLVVAKYLLHSGKVETLMSTSNDPSGNFPIIPSPH